jgi:asparagine synthase (glutamine-hydrolysing)
MVLHFLLYQQASKNGHRYILDGIDGDNATGLSYGYPAQLFRQYAFKHAFRETWLQSKDFYSGFISPYRLLANYVLSAFIPPIVKDCRWRYKRAAKVERELKNSLISDSFAKKVKLAERLDHFDRTHRKHNLSFPGESYLTRIQHPFVTVGVERYNRVASLCSMEPRHPLLDKRLIDFYMGLPWNQFMRNGWSKYLFRRVAEQVIPQDVCWRTGKEHVGYKFTKALFSFKNDTIFAVLGMQNDAMRYMFKEGLSLDLSPNKVQNRPEVNLTDKTDMAGVALWLNNT